MKLLSWNINGLQSAVKKGLEKFVKASDYDILMFQETRSSEIPFGFHLDGYTPYSFAAERAGYSGVMVLSKAAPISVIKGIGNPMFDIEGRVLTMEFTDFYVINAYFPNSRRDLSRLDYKLSFCNDINIFIRKLEEKKPIILGGDFNIAHEEIDIARPAENANNAGFTEKERQWMTSFLKSGHVDTFRLFTDEGGHYTWWSNMYKSRERNIGWRVDYFVVSEKLKNKVKSAGILENTKGSDHAPVFLELLK